MVDLRCQRCDSEDLERDPDAAAGHGIAVRCRSCGYAWRRQPKKACRRCGSMDIDEAPIDSWAYDDIEDARDNPSTAEWSYVDKTIYRCRKCHHEWQVAGESRPYNASRGRGSAAGIQVVSGAASADVLAGFTEPAPLSSDAALRAVPDDAGVHIVWGPQGEVLYAGQSKRTRSRIREHLTGDRQASILHEKIGRRLDRQEGRLVTRDEIRAWLENCTFAYLLTNDAANLKAQIMDQLAPELNEIRPS